MVVIKKILVQNIGDFLYFDYKKNNDHENFLNTNVISEQELAFSEEYIKNNKHIVSSFLDELIRDKNLTKIRIKDINIGLLILDLFVKIKSIKEIYIEDNNPINYDIYLKIIACKSIKYVNCYYIPKYILEQFDKNKIIVESRDEIFFTSHFMEYNKLFNYAKIFYKNKIFIDQALSEEDLKDLATFCQINKHLKEVHLDLFDKNIINNVVSLLYKNRIKNIKIYIHENISNVKIIEYLKKINKEFLKKYKIELKLVYSDDYISNNIFSQLVVNNIKMCSLIIISIFAVFIGVGLFNNYHDQASVENIKKDLKKVVNKKANIKNNVTKVEENEEKKINDVFSGLLKINKDTVGWLKLNNTTIDYPVVQTNDNQYYLNNDYYHNKNYNGWIFADYRNNLEDLDENTIIYGHNKYLNNTMFGPLNEVISEEYLNNKANLTITFNNLYKDMSWKIFSVYKTNKTNDYLTTSFSSSGAYKKFLNIIKNRSIKDFDVEVTTDDKILTLSTCVDSNRRLVIHAVLIK